MKADVIVVGSGPAGTTVGRKIASAGFDVLIIEKEAYPGKNKACGGAVSSYCFSKLKLPRKIIERVTNRIILHFPEKIYEIDSKSSITLFNRENFDRMLANKATEKGARLLVSTLAYDIARNCGKSVVFCKNISKGEKTEVHASLTIFADGTNTLAEKKIGIGFKTSSDSAALAAVYDLEGEKTSNDSLDFFISDEISPFGYGWIFPKKNAINVGVVCLVSKLKHEIKHYLESFLVSQNLDSHEIISYGSRLIPQSIGRKIQDDNIMVVGDAAGTADPITGAGISNAIENAEIAAEVAIKALNNNKLTSGFLSEYERMWKETDNYRLLSNRCWLRKIAFKRGFNSAKFTRLAALSKNSFK
ncbi:MAG: NAD(P)/FAD-dependent oxidoreductase [Asgard group archaeon]|nr:NAD(P)/FAD-dependent oxidoreductase [Asgard group archaeon]